MFRRTNQRYGTTPEPTTPYQRAGQIWDDRIGNARVQAYNWRLAAIGSLGLGAILAAGLIWLAAQSRITPYVVEVDHLGQVRSVGPALEPYQPNDAQIAYYLSRFVSDVRSLSIDPVVVRRNWLEAYDYATDHGAVFLNEFARTNDPFKAVGQRSIAVQVTSVVRLSDASFQVKWIEQRYEHDALVATERWTAILTLVLQQPATADALRKNPLGIYVNGVNWSRELNPGEAP